MENGNRESKIRKVLFNEITILIGIIGFVSSMIWFLATIKIDIALIQSDINTIQLNHEQHIQDIIVEIKTLKDKDTDICEQIIENQKSIIKIITKLEI